MPNQSVRVPKFGEWDGESEGQQFTLIFDNMRADKSMKKGNPNDPEFLAQFLNPSSSSSASSQALAQPPPPSLHESAPLPVKPTSMNHKNQSARVPKFGEWDVDGESEGQQFTLIFDNMRTDKSMMKGNPNDPAFLAEFLNPSSTSSASSQALEHPPSPSLHEIPPLPLKPTSMNHKNQYPHVPKFGEWNVDGESREEQAFTLIFDNMHIDKSMKGVNPNDPAFLPNSVNSLSSSSSSQANVHVVNQLPPPPLRHESSQPPTSRSSMNHKNVMAPKFGNWDAEHSKEYTAIFDGLKQEKRDQLASTHGPLTSTSPTTPLSTHKPFFVSWRLCFSGGHAVRD